jgi:hypothetical protein
MISWLNRLRNKLDPPAAPAAGLLLIVGMHRSGTSCLAGCLERCGLHLGEVSRVNPHNARGNHENVEVRKLHEQILQHSGGSWFQPPSRVKTSRAQVGALYAHAAGLSKRPPAGLKDPRLLLLLDLWEKIAPGCRLAGSFRHPLAVARSLERRNAMPETEALALWSAYNRRLVELHSCRPFPLLEFDLSDPEAYLASLAVMASALGLQPDLPRLREFVSAELEHQNTASLPAPPACQPIYAYLREHAC